MEIKVIKIQPDSYGRLKWDLKIYPVEGDYEGPQPPNPGGWYYCPADMPDQEAIVALISAMIRPIEETIATQTAFLQALKSLSPP
jgi:hypothetical protein